ncbi:hypothetical protein OU426_05000 [Frigidibacter sp. RF13]|uniref:hypothetical protein n=1 Tax=Frigidibacter sp. RF13 TaxID=2997340 RepID=UPI00226DCF87|nr:hypothetical protein [Frigidibacter sp. RF13]MCY1126205.1 hypothetical protein [Frigidibacter sp. RF13]
MIRILPALALTFAAGAAAAIDIPAATAALIEHNRTQCASNGGQLSVGPDAVLQADMNGDGVEDTIFDGSQVSCTKDPQPTCSELGCDLNVIVGTDQHNFIVLGWSVERAGDRVVLRTKQSGFLLNKSEDPIYDLYFDNQSQSWQVVK